VPRLSAKSLPSARNLTLVKDLFAVGAFAEWCLPNVTLGKEFAECKLAFAECNRHSAKPMNPVVLPILPKKEGPPPLDEGGDRAACASLQTSSSIRTAKTFAAASLDAILLLSSSSSFQCTHSDGRVDAQLPSVDGV